MDIYADAQHRLREKVPRVVSQQEYDEFLALGRSLGSYLEASELLESVVLSEDLADRRFLQFYRKLDSLLEPLRFLQSALDTLCQAHSTFNLLWGSVKALMKIAQEVPRIPDTINHGIQDLIESLPIYELYHTCLPTSPQERCPIRKSLETIYTEYLTFCILSRRAAGANIVESVFSLASSENSPFVNCLRIIEHEKRRVHQITAALTFVSVNGLDTKLDMVLDMLDSQSMSSPGLCSSSSSLAHCKNNVPGLLSSAFVGRDHELEWLESIFQPKGENAAGVQVLGIHGMTGIGKTQLMLKYEAKHRSSYMSHVLLMAPTKAKFLSSVEGILAVLGLAQRHRTDPDTKLRDLRDWLSQSDSWLLLIDNVNYETANLVRHLLPSDGSGHAIITSQFQGVVEKVTGSSKLCLELRELELDDAADMFFATVDMDSDDELSRRAATDIVALMGRVPHAIEQSASYIKVNGLDLNAFLARYDRTPEKILEWEDLRNDHDDCGPTDDERRHGLLGAASFNHRFAISRHFQMIYNYLDQSHPDALIVLRFYSFLQQETIPLFDEWYRYDLAPGFSATAGALGLDHPRKLIEIAGIPGLLLSCFVRRPRKNADPTGKTGFKAPPHPSELLSQIFRDESRRERATAKLCDLNLVRRVKGERYLCMHDLTKKTIHTTIPDDDDMARWVSAAMEIVYHMIPPWNDAAKERAFVSICLPAANGLLQQGKSLGLEPWRYACFLALCAQCNFSQGAWEVSLRQFEEACLVYDQHLGPDHPRSLAVRYGLAWAVRYVQDTTLAEGHFRHVWQSRSKVLGDNAPETLEALNDLASTIERAGRLKEAEEMFKSLYEGYQRSAIKNVTDSSSKRTPEALAAAHNLGNCYFNQGRLAEAEKMYLVVLEESSEKLHGGVEDRAVLATMLNYAAALDHDAKFDEAQTLYDTALAGSIKSLGSDHSITLRLRSNIAALQREIGRFDQAEAILEKLLDTETEIYGAAGFETIAELHALGQVWHAKGELKRAATAFEEAINRSGGFLDNSGDPILPRYVGSLGAVEREMGRMASALSGSKLTYERFRTILGCQDPFTLMAANDYAEVLMASGQYQSAGDLLAQSRDYFETLLGKEHPHYAMVLNNLGRLSWAAGPRTCTEKSAAALGFFQEAYTILARRLGPCHFCTLTVALNIARAKPVIAHPETGYPMDGDSVSLVQETRASLESTLGPSHPLTLSCDTVLGMMSAAQAWRITCGTSSGGTGASPKSCLRSLCDHNDQSMAVVISLLTKSRGHLRTAITVAADARLTDSGNYSLSLCLLLTVLRQLRFAASLHLQRAEVEIPSANDVDLEYVDNEIASLTAIMGEDKIRTRLREVALPDAVAAVLAAALGDGGRNTKLDGGHEDDEDEDAHDAHVTNATSFNFDSYIPLFTGETFRLRWGRKNCWRSVTDGPRLQ